MKLRRACCHPRLVRKKVLWAVPSYKPLKNWLMKYWIIAIKPWCLVKFVGHLKLYRELLDKSVSRIIIWMARPRFPQRKKAVNLFQAGEGDLFLNSALKSGWYRLKFNGRRLCYSHGSVVESGSGRSGF